MKRKIHALAGVIGFLTIMTFWSSTVISELSGSHDAIVTVKNSILWGMLVLIPCMIVVGGSGASLSQNNKSKNVLRKKKRMPVIAINGLVILLPSAFFLASKANAGAFDSVFYAVQVLELLAGATNLTLMGLNIRDGLRITGRVGGSKSNNEAYLSLQENGPIIANNLTSLSERDGQVLPTKKIMALCRCGASKNKPFCDGSHTSVNFSSEKSDDDSNNKLLVYKGKDITVVYNRLLCSKAHVCGDKLNSVFDSSRKPWINPDDGDADEIKKVIKECPSGALSYIDQNGDACQEVSSGQSVEIEPNGPYNVRNIPLKEVEVSIEKNSNKYSLCRCGASKNKPFCDGSHTNL